LNSLASRIAPDIDCCKQKQANRSFPSTEHEGVSFSPQGGSFALAPSVLASAKARKGGCQQLKEHPTQITASFAFRADLLHPRKEPTHKGVFAMSTEANKALARRLIEEAWNQGNLATVDELMAPGHVGHHSLVPNQPPSRELYKQYIVRTRTAFPDSTPRLRNRSPKETWS
jgi:hypothetical protein